MRRRPCEPPGHLAVKATTILLFCRTLYRNTSCTILASAERRLLLARKVSSASAKFIVAFTCLRRFVCMLCKGSGSRSFLSDPIQQPYAMRLPLAFLLGSSTPEHPFREPMWAPANVHAPVPKKITTKCRRGECAFPDCGIRSKSSGKPTGAYQFAVS